MPRAKSNGIELEYDTFGSPDDDALLLIMGFTAQMTSWDESFCKLIASNGFYVIRFDNRDVGLSSRIEGDVDIAELFSGTIKSVPYSLDDMAADAAGLLDALGIAKAHIVGASMGGMIAQVFAARHPGRTLSMTSIMSTTGNRWKGQPALRAYPFFMAKPPKSKEQYVERLIKLFGFVGSPGFDRDEDDLRELASTSWDRGHDPTGLGRQLAAIITAEDRAPNLRRIQAPTLVIHGTKDKLVRKSGGKATAKAIPGARLLLVSGMGHDLPRGAWPQIVGAIVDNTARAQQAQAEAAA